MCGLVTCDRPFRPGVFFETEWGLLALGSPKAQTSQVQCGASTGEMFSHRAGIIPPANLPQINRSLAFRRMLVQLRG